MRPAVAICLAGASLAACGGDSDSAADREKERYERQFLAVFEAMEQQPRIDPGEGASIEKQAQAFELGRQRMLRAADELDRIDPPAEIADAHRAYADGIREFAREEMGEMIRALREGGEEAAYAVAGHEPEDRATVERMARARTKFATEGYDLGDVDKVLR